MEGEAWGLSTHPSQPRCASASDDGTVRFWDLKTHRQTAVLSLSGRKARAVGYSHDGSAVAIGFMDGEKVAVVYTCKNTRQRKLKHSKQSPVSKKKGRI